MEKEKGMLTKDDGIDRSTAGSKLLANIIRRAIEQVSIEPTSGKTIKIIIGERGDLLSEEQEQQGNS